MYLNVLAGVWAIAACFGVEAAKPPAAGPSTPKLRSATGHAAANVSNTTNSTSIRTMKLDPPSQADVVNFLRQKISDMETERETLLKSAQQLLKTNTTKILQREIDSLKRAKGAEEEEWQQERKKLEDARSEAQEKSNAAMEVVHNMQEENAKTTQESNKLHKELQALEQRNKELQTDKKNLMASLQNLLRENSDYEAKLRGQSQPVKAPNSKQSSAQQSSDKHVKSVLQHTLTKEQRLQNRKKQVWEDPVAWMGATRAMTDYIARSNADATQASAQESQADGGAPHEPVAASLKAPLSTPAEQPVARASPVAQIMKKPEIHQAQSRTKDSLAVPGSDLARWLEPVSGARAHSVVVVPAAQPKNAQPVDDDGGVQDLLARAEKALGTTD